MTEAILFLFGFSSISAIYEIAKYGKRSRTDKLERAVKVYKKAVK